jgi:uncharacterized protein
MENKIKDYFSHRNNIAAVYFFGSHVAGKERPGSDVDIAVLFQNRDPEPMIDSIDTYMVDLSRLLKKDIHPVVLNHAGETLLLQILNKGKCIVINDQRKLALFKVEAFAKIFDFTYYYRLMQSGLIKSIMQG